MKRDTLKKHLESLVGLLSNEINSVFEDKVIESQIAFQDVFHQDSRLIKQPKLKLLQ